MSESESPRPTEGTLAERIVDALLTTHFGDVGTRLAIRQFIDGEARERDLGGWCRDAAIAEVRRVLQESSHV